MARWTGAVRAGLALIQPHGSPDPVSTLLAPDAAPRVAAVERLMWGTGSVGLKPEDPEPWGLLQHPPDSGPGDEDMRLSEAPHAPGLS